MMKWLVPLIALASLGACASTQRVLSYESDRPDADVHVGNQRFQIWAEHDRLR